MYPVNPTHLLTRALFLLVFYSTGPRGGSGVRRRHEAADQGRRRREHRRIRLQDLRVRFRDRRVFRGHRVGQGKERGRGSLDQELGHRRPPEAPARQASLLDAGGRRHQGRRERLED